jgi:hypothetical protein
VTAQSPWGEFHTEREGWGSDARKALETSAEGEQKGWAQRGQLRHANAKAKPDFSSPLKLLGRHQRMRNGMDGERDAVLHSYFAH